MTPAELAVGHMIRTMHAAGVPILGLRGLQLEDDGATQQQAPQRHLEEARCAA